MTFGEEEAIKIAKIEVKSPTSVILVVFGTYFPTRSRFFFNLPLPYAWYVDGYYAVHFRIPFLFERLVLADGESFF